MRNFAWGWDFASVVTARHALCEEPAFTLSRIGVGTGIASTRRRTMT